MVISQTVEYSYTNVIPNGILDIMSPFISILKISSFNVLPITSKSK